MPKKGYKVIAMREHVYNYVKSECQRLGVSQTQFLQMMMLKRIDEFEKLQKLATKIDVTPESCDSLD